MQISIKYYIGTKVEDSNMCRGSPSYFSHQESISSQVPIGVSRTTELLLRLMQRTLSGGVGCGTLTSIMNPVLRISAGWYSVGWYFRSNIASNVPSKVCRKRLRDNNKSSSVETTALVLMRLTSNQQAAKAGTRCPQHWFLRLHRVCCTIRFHSSATLESLRTHPQIFTYLLNLTRCQTS